MFWVFFVSSSDAFRPSSDRRYVAVTVRARLIGFDLALEEAAQDLGANAWTTFRRVTLPIIFPGVVAGALQSRT